MKIIYSGLFYLTIIIAIALTSMAQKSGEKEVTLKGKLINFAPRVEIEDMSEFQEMRKTPPERIIEADKEGNFSIKFPLGSPGYFRIGRNILYLSPGDQLTVMLDQNYYDQSTFEGIGSEANTYLRSIPLPLGGSFVRQGKNLKPTVTETLSLFSKMAADRQKELAGLKNVSDEFIRLEKARIKADLIMSYSRAKKFSGNILSTLSDERKQQYLDSLQAFTDPEIRKLMKGFIDTSFMNLAVYRALDKDLIKEAKPEDAKQIQVIKDWNRALFFVFHLKDYRDKEKLRSLQAVVDSIQTKKFREVMNTALKEKLNFEYGDGTIEKINK